MILLAKVPFIMMLIGFLWFVAAVLLILLILIQKGKGGGLGAAFGGAGSNSLLGTKTGDFLTWITIGLTVIFLAVGVLMSKFYKPTELKGLQEQTPISAVDTSALLQDIELDEQAEAVGEAVEQAAQETAQTVQEAEIVEQAEQVVEDAAEAVKTE